MNQPATLGDGVQFCTPDRGPLPSTLSMGSSDTLTVKSTTGAVQRCDEL